MFDVSSPTRFDLNFSVAGIPVRVHPLFWVIAILLGGSSSPLLILIWIIAVFISILIHELGHAFAFRRFHVRSQILLHFSGGLTIPEQAAWGGGYTSVGLTPNQHIFVSLAGPFAGFAFAALILVFGSALGGSIIVSPLLGFISIPMLWMPAKLSFLNNVFTIFLWINIFWGLINLLPVYPLDGGQVSRAIFIQRDPLDGLVASLWLSVIVGGALALGGWFVFGSLYMAFLFGMLAFQSYQTLQAAKRY
ncbi:MAG: site-2 protease family protein [Anaerolineales bacterium]|nr:site-2 protease family protein [Anaerolineales bacterium]